MICSRFKSLAALALIFFTISSIPSVECANKKSSAPTPAVHEPTIEEVTAKQLERILAEKDYVAVYWCKSGRTSSECGLLWINSRHRQWKSEKQFRANFHLKVSNEKIFRFKTYVMWKKVLKKRVNPCVYVVKKNLIFPHKRKRHENSGEEEKRDKKKFWDRVMSILLLIW